RQDSGLFTLLKGCSITAIFLLPLPTTELRDAKEVLSEAIFSNTSVKSVFFRASLIIAGCCSNTCSRLLVNLHNARRWYPEANPKTTISSASCTALEFNERSAQTSAA